jgi:hypothetical protein
MLNSSASPGAGTQVCATAPDSILFLEVHGGDESPLFLLPSLLKYVL